MATINTRGKGHVLIRDIISRYHPKFQVDAELVRMGLADPDMFNVERLIEHTLAAEGNLNFVDAEGYDFLPDYSDSKTVSVNENTGVAEIGSVETKIGALRIVCFNPLKDAADFFYVPKNCVKYVKRACFGNNSHKERITFTYSRKYSDDYGQFETYRLRTFQQLARSRG